MASFSYSKCLIEKYKVLGEQEISMDSRADGTRYLALSELVANVSGKGDRKLWQATWPVRGLGPR